MFHAPLFPAFQVSQPAMLPASLPRREAYVSPVPAHSYNFELPATIMEHACLTEEKVKAPWTFPSRNWGRAYRGDFSPETRARSGNGWSFSSGPAFSRYPAALALRGGLLRSGTHGKYRGRNQFASSFGSRAAHRDDYSIDDDSSSIVRFTVQKRSSWKCTSNLV